MSVIWFGVGMLVLVPLLIVQRRRIAELRRSHENLRSAEAGWRFTQELMEAMPCPVFYKGVDGRYLGCNAAFAEYLGRRRDEIVGRTTHDVAPKALADRYAAADAALFAQTGTQVYEVQVQWADGSLRDVVMHKATFAQDGAAVSGLIGVITDITDRKRAEEQVLRLKDELEHRVLERTAQLEARNVELMRARDAAEAANRAKGVFLANMTHELRTPLNAILGFAQLLENDPAVPQERRRQISVIGRSGNHLLSLINDVLEISRIEAGGMSIHNAAFDLGAVLASVEEIIRIRAEARGLAFSAERSGDLPASAIGDASQLRQVLLNLLGNAVKYVDRGQIGLRVRTEGAGRVHFEVIDTGPGISKEEQESVFLPFYQTETGIAKGEGTGLGLAISREIVRVMGGELTVASAPGEGSIFGFTIPLPAAGNAAGAGSGARITGLAAGQPAPRILVAEDHKDNQAVVKRLLEEIGCEVELAGNGQEAIELFRSWRPDLILMDVRMPVMDGYEATRAIRALPEGRALPILALTASAFEEDRNRILAAGCDEMLGKPIDADALFSVIGKMLGLRYRYSADTARVEATDAACDLSALPARVRQELAKAAEALDSEVVRTIVNVLAPQYPREAGAIAQLVESFDFAKLEKLCRQIQDAPAE